MGWLRHRKTPPPPSRHSKLGLTPEAVQQERDDRLDRLALRLKILRESGKANGPWGRPVEAGDKPPSA